EILRCLVGSEMYIRDRHIQLLAERDGVRVGRSYSLTRVVGERLEIAVKRHPDGLLSPWLCEHLAVGQRVELQPAQGDLRWPMQAEAVCLLAAGSGLTPLLGLLREALENGYRGPVLWLHLSLIHISEPTRHL
ncbi:hypothetical protein KZ846_35480, partial [Pseudomonas aeruginosa]|nr:hypothetical protein [Pseudomonas aeruginosa]